MATTTKHAAVLQVVHPVMLIMNFGGSDSEVRSKRRKSVINNSDIFSFLRGPAISGIRKRYAYHRYYVIESTWHSALVPIRSYIWLQVYMTTIVLLYYYLTRRGVYHCYHDCAVARGGSAILIATKIPRHRARSRTRRRPMTISERSVTGKRAGGRVRKIYPRRRTTTTAVSRGVLYYCYLRVFSSVPHDLHITCALQRRELSSARYRPRENCRA